jgi:hypothetical protein
MKRLIPTCSSLKGIDSKGSVCNRGMIPSRSEIAKCRGGMLLKLLIVREGTKKKDRGSEIKDPSNRGNTKAPPP